MTMPGPSNREVVAEAAQARPDLKVVLTSAYSEDMAVSNMWARQIRGFLRKPFRLEELVETLRSVLSLPATQETTEASRSASWADGQFR
jgi:DNA-binding NarL/FixJ family response regulator